ncbi:MAG: hypothetical protein ACSLFK_17065 [Gemmatimonadaceae bacterium]
MTPSKVRPTPLWLFVVAVFCIGGPVFIGLGFAHQNRTGHGAGPLMGWLYLVIALLVTALGWLALRGLWRRVARDTDAP